MDNFAQSESPTVDVLGVWSRLNPAATVGDLLGALTDIERYDILHSEAVRDNIGQSQLGPRGLLPTQRTERKGRNGTDVSGRAGTIF